MDKKAIQLFKFQHLVHKDCLRLYRFLVKLAKITIKELHEVGDLNSDVDVD